MLIVTQEQSRCRLRHLELEAARFRLYLTAEEYRLRCGSWAQAPHPLSRIKSTRLKSAPRWALRSYEAEEAEPAGLFKPAHTEGTDGIGVRAAIRLASGM